MADANARRAVEQEKLNTWCARMGIQSASDLAFWFTSYEEALREAGRAVAERTGDGSPGSAHFCEGDSSPVSPATTIQCSGSFTAFVFGGPSKAVFICWACQAQEEASPAG